MRQSDVKSPLRLLRRVMTASAATAPTRRNNWPEGFDSPLFLAAIRFHSADPKETIPARHAPLPLLHADPTRDPEGGGGRLPPADVAGRPHPPRGRRDLRVAAARLSRAQEDRTDRARG